MPTLGILEDTWRNQLRSNQRAVMRGAFTKLSLGTNPALYLSQGGGPRVEWYIFDDKSLDAEMLAVLGTLTNVVSELPAGWPVPRHPDGRIDRAAIQDKAVELVQASIVCPDDIVSPEDDTWPQGILDAQVPPTHPSMKGWLSLQPNWTLVGET